MKMNQRELNQQLYMAASIPEPDLNKVEGLLKLGADPMGYFDELFDCVMDEVFVDSQGDRSYSKHLPELVTLFLRYGMNVESSEDAVLHPLTWIRNEYGVQTLQILMDAGLSSDYAEGFAIDLIGAICQFETSLDWDDAYNDDTTWRESLDFAAKMILLLASYERVFRYSRYIRELVCAREEEWADFEQFRKWDDFQCDVKFKDFCYVDSETNEKYKSDLGAGIVFEKATGKRVRRIRFIGELDISRSQV